MSAAEPRRILTVFGTRPEAIKLAPVARRFDMDERATHAVCVTGQHREMLDQALESLAIGPRWDLNVMRPDQGLSETLADMLSGLAGVIREFRPHWVVVQGDTSTALAGALAGFHHRARVAHVEAGLRTGDLGSPWPEEANRSLIGRIADLHFAPTQQAARNLTAEGVPPERVVVSGNTIVDALRWVARTAPSAPACGRRMVLVTGHRRENFDGGLAAVCRALARVAARDDVEILYAVHLNPQVQATVRSILGERDNVRLTGPIEYAAFVRTMARAHLIVTDSGGIQEEAPSLGVPVLVTRNTTERPEAVDAGAARLVGPLEEPLYAAICELLDNPAAHAAMSQARDLFGDGRAAERIVSRVLEG